MKERELDGVDLDRELNSAEQQWISGIVKSLPDEVPSLAWRSELNARLRKAAARSRRLNLFGWIWKPAAGLALAGAVAVAFMTRTAMVSPLAPHADVEKALVNAHIESTASWEVAGDGMTANEAKEVGTGTLAPADWEQEDVGATL